MQSADVQPQMREIKASVPPFDKLNRKIRANKLTGKKKVFKIRKKERKKYKFLFTKTDKEKIQTLLCPVVMTEVRSLLISVFPYQVWQNVFDFYWQFLTNTKATNKPHWKDSVIYIFFNLLGLLTEKFLKAN